MSNITEHHSEQEWEGNDRKQTGIDLLVRCDTVCIHYRLEPLRKLVGSVERRRGPISAEFVEDRGNARSRFLLVSVISGADR